jgi:hypothetical protein
MSFKDLYSSSRYAVPIKARTSVSINGIDLRSFGFELTEMPNISMPPTRQRSTVIDGRSGSIPMGDLYDNWDFSIDGQIVGTSSEDIIKKKDALLQWIDVEQMSNNKMVIGDKEFYGLNFELSGAPLYYNQGSVGVTGGTKTVNGTDTLFADFVKPGVTFEVLGDNKIYTVESISSDNVLTVDSNIERTTASGLSYRIERKRYLLVRYSGSSSLTPAYTSAMRQTTVGQDSEVAWNLSISFYTNYPYWIGDLFNTEFSDSDSDNGVFLDLNGIGTTQVSPKYIFEGIANLPRITTGIYSFYSDFNTTQKARTFYNDVDSDPSTAISSPVYLPYSSGYAIKNTAALNYTNVLGHTSEGSAVIRFKFISGVSTGSIINWKERSSNYTKLLIQIDSDSINFVQDYGSTTPKLEASTTEHLSGNEVEFSAWWNNSGVIDDKDGTKYYIKFMLNGEIIGASTFAPNLQPAYLGDLSVGGAVSNIAISELALFNQSLSDEDLRSFYYSGDSLYNHNRSISSSTSCASNDILTYDTVTGDAEFYDSLLSAKVSIMENITGTPPVVIGYGTNERAKIFLKTSSANTNKLHVIYRPHFR